jgi:hypothetical protein
MTVGVGFDNRHQIDAVTRYRLERPNVRLVRIEIDNRMCAGADPLNPLRE